MSSTRERVPEHLRRFVVQQDYDAYTPIDHAVWRFVVTQLLDRLSGTAHPGYVDGLRRTGMSPDRIPRIDEMDDCLSEFGWGAVCVDGFIPPRAFQEFQWQAILPIAAEIRTVEHLAYTPAPDIIHEAAGHAPILTDPEYAAFLRRIGEQGTRAFASARDGEVYDAIYELSVLKESREATPGQVEQAQGRLQALIEQPTQPSEAALLSRLYWWTVEYGLVGTVDDYRLYGAGLLSSLGESHFCHAPSVRKLPLTRDCVEVDYDITREQPQLFVARDFAQLTSVLDEVTRGFAFRRGDAAALRVAADSGEVASVSLDSGVFVTGRVAELIEGARGVACVRLSGPCAIGRDGVLAPGRQQGLLLALGPLADGTRPHEHGTGELQRRYAPEGERLRLRYASGLEVSGRLRRSPLSGASGGGAPPSVLELEHPEVRLFDTPVPCPDAALLRLPVGCSATSVAAGAVDASYYERADFATQTVPERRQLDARSTELCRLYLRAQQVRGSAAEAALRLQEVAAALDDRYPHDWFVRYWLLERLHQLELAPELQHKLTCKLQALEHHYQGRHPIATGLRYLRSQG